MFSCVLKITAASWQLCKPGPRSPAANNMSSAVMAAVPGLRKRRTSDPEHDGLKATHMIRSEAKPINGRSGMKRTKLILAWNRGMSAPDAQPTCRAHKFASMDKVVAQQDWNAGSKGSSGTGRSGEATGSYNCQAHSQLAAIMFCTSCGRRKETRRRQTSV